MAITQVAKRAKNVELVHLVQGFEADCQGVCSNPAGTRGRAKGFVSVGDTAKGCVSGEDMGTEPGSLVVEGDTARGFEGAVNVYLAKRGQIHVFGDMV